MDKYIQNNQKSIEKYIEEHSWNNAKTDSDVVCLESDLIPDNFLLILTSKSLLSNVIRQNEAEGKTTFHIDATYKLINNGFSLITMGTENINHKFALIACGICAHEDSYSYERFLTRIKEALYTHYNFDWKPTWILSDAAESISKALNKVFPSVDHLRCFFHTIKALQDKINRWKDILEKKQLKENWGFIHYGMTLLHRTRSDEDFLLLWNLIKSHWTENYPKDFVDYVQKNFIDNKTKLRWNRMGRIGYNLTNNSLERWHLDLKSTYTKFTKMKLNQFLFKAKTFIRDYSLDYQNNFKATIEIPVEIWRKGLLILENKERGPFYDIRESYALFIKKKRDINKSKDRKK